MYFHSHCLIFPNTCAHAQLSSVGLIYRHYGREIIQAFAAEAKVEVNTQLLEEIYLRLYRGFVEHVDAIDNGIDHGDNIKYNIRFPSLCCLPHILAHSQPQHADSQPRHGSTTLSSRVGKFNPKWNDKGVTDATRNAAFKKAMLVCADEFASRVEDMLLVWLPARSIVAQARVLACAL